MKPATVGERLKKLRKRKKLSQQELADRLGINRSTYARYETGDTQADYDTLVKIANFFDTSVDYLLGRTNIPDPIPTIAFHRTDDPMADLPEEARKSVEEFLEYIRKKYNLEDD